ncbi:MAG TPA: SufE family protein [Bacteroidia bacterium]|nr:SufE family protein [Bacteroidia bacterium]
METIITAEQEIIEEFELFDDWSDKYQYIIEIGQKLPELDGKYKVDENKIRGCQSSVWLHAYENAGKIFFDADSDSVFVKGEIALLIRVLSGRTADEIIDAELHFIDAIGLRQHIAVTRANGLASMIKQMKLYAIGMK